MSSELDFKSQFEHYQPIFKEHIKGDDVKILAEKIDVSYPTLYSYLGGKIPKKPTCKYLIEEGVKMLRKLNVYFIEI